MEHHLKIWFATRKSYRPLNLPIARIQEPSKTNRQNTDGDGGSRDGVGVLVRDHNYSNLGK